MPSTFKLPEIGYVKAALSDGNNDPENVAPRHWKPEERAAFKQRFNELRESARVELLREKKKAEQQKQVDYYAKQKQIRDAEQQRIDQQLEPKLRARQMVASGEADSSVRSLKAGLGQAKAEIGSAGKRLLGDSDEADEMIRKSNLDEQAHLLLDKDDNIPDFLQHNVRGATRSLTEAVIVGAYGGLFGLTPSATQALMALQAGGTVENRAITEGKDAGLKSSDLYSYVALQGVSEVFFSLALQGLGKAGLEKLLTQRFTKAGALNIAKETGNAYFHELMDEIPTELIQAEVDKRFGVDKTDWTIEQLTTLLADTLAQTGMMSGATSITTGIMQQAMLEQDEKATEIEVARMQERREQFAEKMAALRGYDYDEVLDAINNAVKARDNKIVALGDELAKLEMTTTEYLWGWAQENPELADDLINNTNPSRQDWKRYVATNSQHQMPNIRSGKQRAKVAERMRELRDIAIEQDKTMFQEETMEQEPVEEPTETISAEPTVAPDIKPDAIQEQKPETIEEPSPEPLVEQGTPIETETKPNTAEMKEILDLMSHKELQEIGEQHNIKKSIKNKAILKQEIIRAEIGAEYAEEGSITKNPIYRGYEEIAAARHWAETQKKQKVQKDKAPDTATLDRIAEEARKADQIILDEKVDGALPDTVVEGKPEEIERPGLFDEEEKTVLKVKEGSKAEPNQEFFNTDKDIVRVPTRLIKTAPKTFQYKIEVDEKGVRKQLEGPWDDRVSGIMLLWKSNDGDYYVVNGHHRLELAQRESVPDIRAVILNEADGVTAEDARLRGAIENIKSERGSIADTTEMWRLTNEKDLEAVEKEFKGKPRGTNGYKIGRYATDATYDLFRSGRLTEQQATAVSFAAPNSEADQKTALNFLEKYKDATANDIARYLASLKAFKSDAVAQGGLFDNDEEYKKQEANRLLLSKIAAQQINEIKRQLTIVRSGNRLDSSNIAKDIGIEISSEEDLGALKKHLEQEAREFDKFWKYEEKEAILQAIVNEEEAGIAAEQKPEPVVEKKKKTIKKKKPAEPVSEKNVAPKKKKVVKKKAPSYKEVISRAKTVNVDFTHIRKKGQKAIVLAQVIEAEQKVDTKQEQETTTEKTPNDLVEEYIGYAEQIASSYKNVNLDEAKSEAGIALMKASRSFDKTKGDFKAYAGKVIRSKLNTLYGKEKQIKSKEGVSLDQPVGDATVLGDTFATTEEISSIERNEVKTAIDDSISKLSEEEQKIARMAYDEKTNKEIAKELGITEEGARKKKLKIYDKMRSALSGFVDDTDALPSDRAFSAIYRGETSEETTAKMNVGEMVRILKETNEKVPGVYKELSKKGVQGQFRGERGIALKSDIAIGPVVATGLAANEKVDSVSNELVKIIKATFPEINDSNIKVVIKADKKKKGKKRITIYKKDEGYAATVLAHEIGHWVDYMPDKNMARGNILGRLATLEKYMKSTLDKFQSIEGMDPKEASKLRAKARKEAGKSPDKKLTKEYTAWKSKVDAKFAALAAAEGYITRGQITQELKDLTRWWNPFNPDKDKKYTSYRYSSKELYAEAISVLLNNPGELRKRAPLFYATFFQLLERKGEVKDAYNKIVREVVSGTSGDEMLNDLYEGFERAEEEKRKIAESNKKEFSITNILGTAFVDKFWTLNRAVINAKKNGRKTVDPRILIDKAKYSGSQIAEYHYRNHAIAVMLEKNGVSEGDFGAYLMHMRHLHAKGEGGDMFIPVYGDLAGLQKADEAFRKRMGPEKMKALEQARKDFRKNRKEMILDRIQESKPYSQEFIDFLMDNEYYSRNEVVDYMDRKHGKGSGLKMFERVGTLKEINNPWLATMAADETMIYTLNWNHAKQAVNDFLSKDGTSDQYQKAEKAWNGTSMTPVESSDNKMALITFMRDGKIEGFYTDKNTAHAFDGSNRTVSAVASLLRFFAHPARIWFTSMRPGFQLYNAFYRDPMRTVINTGVNPFTLYKQLAKSIKVASKDIVTHTEKDMVKLRKEGYLLHWGQLSEQDDDTRQLERMLGDFRDEHLWDKKIRNPLSRFWSTIMTLGAIGETANKHAAYVTMKENQVKLGLSDEQIGRMTIHEAGSPSFATGGELTPITNNLMLFSNAPIQGWRSDYAAFKRDPVGVATRRIAYSIVPKIVAIGIMKGALEAILRYMGADDDDESMKWARAQKRILSGVSEYDMANYHVIPLGLSDSGKSVYLRLPQEETSRAIGGAFTKLITGDDFLGGITDAASYMGDQGPGWNPVLTLGQEVFTYLSGGNPYDDFREKPAVPDRIRKAGGSESHKIFSKWLWNRYGGSMVYRFKTDNPEEIKSTLEKFLELPFSGDTVGRFIRVSDYGISQKTRRAVEEERAKGTRRSIEVDKAVRKDIRGEKLSETEKRLLSEERNRDKSKRKTLKAYGGNVVDKALANAHSSSEKAAVLKTLLKLEGKTPAVMEAIQGYAGQQMYIISTGKPKDPNRYAEWSMHQKNAMDNIRGLPVKDKMKAFNDYWLNERGYKKTKNYYKRVRAIKRLN